MASKRRLRRKSCERKIRYETSKIAWGVVTRMGNGVTAYNCSFCGGYHVGHQKVKHESLKFQR